MAESLTPGLESFISIVLILRLLVALTFRSEVADLKAGATTTKLERLGESSRRYCT